MTPLPPCRKCGSQPVAHFEGTPIKSMGFGHCGLLFPEDGWEAWASYHGETIEQIESRRKIQFGRFYKPLIGYGLEKIRSYSLSQGANNND